MGRFSKYLRFILWGFVGLLLLLWMVALTVLIVKGPDARSFPRVIAGPAGPKGDTAQVDYGILKEYIDANFSNVQTPKNGKDGVGGVPGPSGPAGASGQAGETGSPGQPGPSGAQGETGAMGRTPEFRCVAEANRIDIRYSNEDSFQAFILLPAGSLCP